MDALQQLFLRDAMRRLNMTRDAFAKRIGSKRRTLDSWLLPESSGEFREMPDIARQYVTELVSQIIPDQKYTQSVDSACPWQPLAGGSSRHLLSIRQFTRDRVEDVFRLADIMRPIAQRRMVSRVLEGAVLANLFFEASTRTRISFGAAFNRLGGSVCDTTGFTFSSMAKGESIADTSRVISGYVDAVVVRHPEEGAVAEFAAATNIPVINGGDGPGEHPTQALLDLYTIQREFSVLDKEVDGCHIVMVGDLKYGRTVHSLIQLLALYRGLKFTLISPPSLTMPQAIIDAASRGGHVVEVKHDPLTSLSQADVVYTTRIQRERLGDEVIEGLDNRFAISKALIETCCQPNVVIMHPLPRDSRPNSIDLSVDLNDDRRLAIFRQTDNGIPIRMALFAFALGVDHLVQSTMREATWWSPKNVGRNDVEFK